MVEACVLQGEMHLGWDEECEQAVITDWEASKLVKFDPSIGTQIRLTRPAVIISGTAFNVRSKVTLDLAQFLLSWKVRGLGEPQLYFYPDFPQSAC